MNTEYRLQSRPPSRTAAADTATATGATAAHRAAAAPGPTGPGCSYAAAPERFLVNLYDKFHYGPTRASRLDKGRDIFGT